MIKVLPTRSQRFSSAVPGELIHSPVAMADWGGSVVLGDHEA